MIYLLFFYVVVVVCGGSFVLNSGGDFGGCNVYYVCGNGFIVFLVDGVGSFDCCWFGFIVGGGWIGVGDYF